jgi:hypothetical protein
VTDDRDETAAVEGEYFHGGRAFLREGGMVRTGQRPNPWGDTFDENGRSVFVYCTTDLNTAESYADAIRSNGGRGHVYRVRPTGSLLPDHNGRDFKSRSPLEVIERLA